MEGQTLPTTFIFQGNPDRFDIEGYLAQAKGRISWLMTSSFREIRAGDQVFIWRAKGSKRLYESYGIVAHCIAEGAASKRTDDPDSIQFWRENEGTNVAHRVGLRIISITDGGLLLDHKQIADNPVLVRTGPLGYRAGINYKLKPNEAAELHLLWAKFIETTMYKEKIEQTFDSQVSIFEKFSLDRLIEEYRSGLSRSADGPVRTRVSTFVFQRSALVRAIARVRADFRCEIPNCVTPSFPTLADEPYSEVHHLLRLADGGRDTIDNVVCVCANHHRELHVGSQREVLTNQLRSVRA
jgi:hypothetical protein